MKYITLGIPDNLYTFVLDIFKHIPQATIKEEAEFEVREWQKKIVRKRIKNSKHQFNTFQNPDKYPKEY
mgnify:CR=1 FL=1